MLLKVPWYPVRLSRDEEEFWNRAHCCHALSLFVYSEQFRVMTCSRNMRAWAQSFCMAVVDFIELARRRWSSCTMVSGPAQYSH